MTAPLFILNGPNLNLLGTRQPEIYGAQTLADIEKICRETAKTLGLDIYFTQTNHEGELVDLIQRARANACGIVINPAAYSHTSVAVLDALLACGLPVVEVHLSNIHKRDDFRRRSFVSQAADAVICGCGAYGYELAVRAVSRLIAGKQG